jgi:very-short-patch-repair endonuclease
MGVSMGQLTSFARDLRKRSTDAETALWRRLRNRRLADFKFRRQHVVGNFILDFYCPTVKLAIEVDGGGHGDEDCVSHDAERTAVLQEKGIRVLRFWNHEVLRQTETVMEEIYRALMS